MPKGIPDKRYTPEFNKMAVETMRTENLSYVDAARRFKVSCAKSAVSWERIYPEEGLEGLSLERRGRPRKFPKAVHGLITI